MSNHLSVFLLCLPGFAALALATARAQQDTMGRELGQRTIYSLRALGWALLAAALWHAITAIGWGFGLVAYSGHTSVAAAMVLLALVACNRWRKRHSKPRRSATALGKG